VNLGESHTTTLSRLIELVSGAMGVEPTIERLPLQPGDVKQTFADVSKAERLLGYRPTTKPEEGIPRFVAWFQGERASRSGVRDPGVGAREPGE
jgi:UDP-glucuronate 4-epimerase